MYRPSIIMALLVFSTEFDLLLCHLKDLGEKNDTMSVLFQEFEDRVLGGESTTLHEYPFNVQFFNYGGMCGGSILTRKTVLTAAHCFDHNKNVAEMTVISNSLYIRHARTSRRHPVWDFVIHEKYDDPIKYANDMAMIIIHDVFNLTETVQMAVLTNSIAWMNETKAKFIATGWGIVEMRRRALQKTTLRYVPNKECSDMNALQLTEGMFCLYGDQQRDTCRGDSGGGIVWNK
ncbi:serine protease 52-like [Ostrinia furnacalis]|uniref:serine protease 52-like n=1 Tax=Ostrinia furnacalis TaxID=93504 RepID=UPI001040D360|nr:serine protease 52-like [Ostrinia furnacalis]